MRALFRLLYLLSVTVAAVAAKNPETLILCHELTVLWAYSNQAGCPSLRDEIRNMVLRLAHKIRPETTAARLPSDSG